MISIRAIVAILNLLCVFQAVASELGKSRDVEFESAYDKTVQRYVVRLPEDFNNCKSHDVLIALHGHGSDRWQFAESRNWQECIAVRDAAAEYDLIFVSPDYRARTSWMGPAAEADVVQIISEIKKRFKVNRVFICGASMGGSSALTFAVLHPELIAGVAAMNPTVNHIEYDNFQDAIAQSFGGTKKEILEEYKKRSAEYWPERIRFPVAITVGGKDTIVPPDSASRFAVVLKKASKQVLFINRPATGHSTSYDDTVAAMEFMLDPADATISNQVKNGESNSIK